MINNTYLLSFTRASLFTAPIFMAVLYFFMSLGTTNQQQADADKIKTPTEVISEGTGILRCMNDKSHKKSLNECEQANKPPALLAKNNNQHRVGELLVINSIYFFQWLCLNFQFALFIYSKNKQKQIHQAFSHLSEWSVNSGPMLGVLGTIISFAFLLSKEGPEGLASFFSIYFFDAAITTIMGGLVYISCLAMNIRICPSIKW